MSQVKTGNTTHDNTVGVSEGSLQSMLIGASQASIRTSEINHYRACLKSAIANNCGTDTFMTALRSLGVTS